MAAAAFSPPLFEPGKSALERKQGAIRQQLQGGSFSLPLWLDKLLNPIGLRALQLLAERRGGLSRTEEEAPHTTQGYATQHRGKKGGGDQTEEGRKEEGGRGGGGALRAELSEPGGERGKGGEGGKEKSEDFFLPSQSEAGTWRKVYGN